MVMSRFLGIVEGKYRDLTMVKQGVLVMGWFTGIMVQVERRCRDMMMGRFTGMVEKRYRDMMGEHRVLLLGEASVLVVFRHRGMFMVDHRVMVLTSFKGIKGRFRDMMMGKYRGTVMHHIACIVRC